MSLLLLRHTAKRRHLWVSMDRQALRHHPMPCTPVLTRMLSSETKTKRSSTDDEKRDWKQAYKPSRLTWIAVGCVLGAVGGSYFAYLNLAEPVALERRIADTAISAFNTALSFEHREKIYLSLPEFNFPLDHLTQDLMARLEAAERDMEQQGQQSSHKEQTGKFLGEWADLVLTAHRRAQSSFLLQAKIKMRESLLSGLNEPTRAQGSSTPFLPPIRLRRSLDHSPTSANSISNASAMTLSDDESELSVQEMTDRLAAVRRLLPPCLER
eukprot:g3425.t1